MRSIFDYTIGRKSEDTTTGVLHYLINREKSGDTNTSLRAFFGIPDNSFVCTDQYTIQGGRPDLFICSQQGDAYCLAIENKLGAGFTVNNDGEHQIFRYWNFLASRHEKEKSLVILAPSHRRSEIEAIIKDLKENHGVKENPKINVLEWEKLCQQLHGAKHDTSIAEELSKFVNRQNQTMPPMTTDEIECLQNRTNGMAVVNALKFIDAIQARFDGAGPAEFDPDDNSFGFYFGPNRAEYWFGFFPECWAQHGHPFALQNRTIAKKDSRFQYKIEHEGEPVPGYWYLVKNIGSIDSICAEVRAIMAHHSAGPNSGEQELHE